MSALSYSATSEIIIYSLLPFCAFQQIFLQYGNQMGLKNFKRFKKNCLSFSKFLHLNFYFFLIFMVDLLW